VTAIFQPRPWSAGDVRRAVAGNALGFGCIAAGWMAAARNVTLATQSKWAVLSVAGLMVAGVANAIFLRRGRRAVGSRSGRFMMTDGSRQGPAPAVPGVIASGGLVAGAGLTMYHRPDCRLVIGKAVQAGDRAVHQEAGRQPCEVCRP
jgi:hypothetical protein